MTKQSKKRENFDPSNFFQIFYLDSGGFWRNFDVSKNQNFVKISEKTDVEKKKKARQDE